MNYGYLAQKLASARSCLMLPHPKGITESVALAMHDCMIALDEVKDERPEQLEPYVSRLLRLMNTDGLLDPDRVGLHKIRANMFTEDDMFEFSRTVDELASLCTRYNFESLS